MAGAIKGKQITGNGVTYTTPNFARTRIEAICFTLACDATAGIHKAKVAIIDASGLVVARLRDLNEGGPTETLAYTYGIGLNASACVTVTGWEMTDALPNTIYAANTDIRLTAVNDAGATIAGDVFSNVVLYGDILPDQGGVLDLTPQPLLVPTAV